MFFFISVLVIRSAELERRASWTQFARPSKSRERSAAAGWLHRPICCSWMPALSLKVARRSSAPPKCRPVRNSGQMSCVASPIKTIHKCLRMQCERSVPQRRRQSHVEPSMSRAVALSAPHLRTVWRCRNAEGFFCHFSVFISTSLLKVKQCRKVKDQLLRQGNARHSFLRERRPACLPDILCSAKKRVVK